MKVRIAEVFSLNAFSGEPETNYMVQTRRWGRWGDVRQHTKESDAKAHKEKLENE